MHPPNAEPTPQLPRLLAVPFASLPNRVHSHFLALALTRTLHEPLHAGELDFLQHHALSIKVRDAGITFGLTLDNGRLVATRPDQNPDWTIEGRVYDFLQLISRQVDPDTLVFQRRLVIQGNTELGLQVKNFLDGLDLESIAFYEHLEPALLKILPLYKKLFHAVPHS